MENNEKIENLNILDLENNTNIFDTNINYQIPIYQRDLSGKMRNSPINRRYK